MFHDDKNAGLFLDAVTGLADAMRNVETFMGDFTRETNKLGGLDEDQRRAALAALIDNLEDITGELIVASECGKAALVSGRSLLLDREAVPS